MKEGGAAGLLNEGGGAAGLLNEGGGSVYTSIYKYVKFDHKCACVVIL